MKCFRRRLIPFSNCWIWEDQSNTYLEAHHSQDPTPPEPALGHQWSLPRWQMLPAKNSQKQIPPLKDLLQTMQYSLNYLAAQTKGKQWRFPKCHVNTLWKHSKILNWVNKWSIKAFTVLRLLIRIFSNSLKQFWGKFTSECDRPFQEFFCLISDDSNWTSTSH